MEIDVWNIGGGGDRRGFCLFPRGFRKQMESIGYRHSNTMAHFHFYPYTHSHTHTHAHAHFYAYTDTYPYAISHTYAYAFTHTNHQGIRGPFRSPWSVYYSPRTAG